MQKENLQTQYSNKKIVSILVEAKKTGIHLSYKDGKLYMRAEKKDIPEYIIEKLKDNKQNIINFFESSQAQQSLPKLSMQSRCKENTWYPLTMAQQQIWVANNFHKNDSEFLIRSLFRLEGEVDSEWLNSTVYELTKLHASLRTEVKEFDGEPRQKFRSLEEISKNPLKIIDIESDLDQQELSNFCNKPLPINSENLFDVILLKVTNKYAYLIFRVHHIISDGVSMQIIFDDFSDFYNKKTLSKPRITYIDFSIWENSVNVQGIYHEKCKFWQTMLEGYEPHQFSRKLMQDASENLAGMILNHIDVALLRKIKSFASARQVSISNIMLSAYYILVSYYLNLDDLVIAVPNANRKDLLLERCVGLFVNILPMRLVLTSENTFLDVLNSVKMQYLNSYQYQSLPFNMICQSLDGEIRPEDLIQVTYNYAVAQDEHLALDGLNIKSVPIKIMNSTGALNLSVKESKNKLRLYLDYNSAFFDEWMAVNFLQNYIDLINNLINFPNRKLVRQNYLSDSDCNNMLNLWNGRINENYLNNTLSGMLYQCQKKDLKNTACIFNDNIYSHHDLYHYACVIASSLKQHNIEQGDYVVLFIERSFLQIAAIIGTLYSGATYIPVEVNTPMARFEQILLDSGAKIIITTSVGINNLREKIDDRSFLIVDGLNYDKNFLEIELSVNTITPESIAYVIYTSGSTGIPKGTLIKQSSISNLLCWLMDTYPLVETDVMLYLTSYAFDASLEAIFYPLLSGAKICIVAHEQHKDINVLINLIKVNQVTVITLVPSILSIFIDAGGIEQCPTLKRIITGGEVLPVKDAEYIINHSSIELINTYGPTETTVEVTHFQITKASLACKSISIGKPITNMKAYILDRNLNLVPIGFPGELYFSGAGLSVGYLNQNSLTKEKFLNNPYKQSGHETIYRTGDVACWKDGLLYYLGRRDQQVKLHGQRIELDEIESVIIAYENISSVVVLIKNINNKQNLVVYYTGEGIVDEIAIRNYLKDKLPTYMIPSYYIQLNSFPLLSNDKIDRKKLSQLELVLPSNDRSEELNLPSNAKERLIYAVWKEVLSLEKFDVHDNFFHLGGDSIYMMKILVQLRKKNLYVTIKDFFENQSVSELAKVAGSVEKIKIEEKLIGFNQHLTPIQSWYFFQRYNNVNYWNQIFRLKYKKLVDIRKMQDAIQYVCDYHDVFKLAFKYDGYRWLAEYKDKSLYDFCCIDLSEISADKKLKRLFEVASNAQAGLNIQDGPLAVFLHVNLTKEDQRLIIIIHHLIVDGVSWRILIDDINNVYQSLTNNKPIILPQKTSSYQAWGNSLRDYENNITNNVVQFWKNINENIVSSIPTDMPDGSNIYSSQSRKRVCLSEQDTNCLLRYVLKELHTSVTSILLTPVMHAINKVFNIKKALVELEGHGRDGIDDADVSRTVGWFTTIYPILIEMEDNASLSANINRVEKTLNSIPNRGFDYLFQYNKYKKLRENTPQISFNYLGHFGAEGLVNTIFDMGYEDCGFPVAGDNQRSHLFNIVIAVVDNQLSIDWNYSHQLYHDQTIEMLCNQYLEELQSLICMIKEK